MKRIATLITTAFLAIALYAGCSSSSGTPSLEGPLLTMDEAQAMVIDQFYANGGTEDEYTTSGEFTVYLRDAVTGKDVACAAPEDGMAKLTKVGIYYAGISIPIKEVDGDHPESVAQFRVVFVEKDGDACPQVIQGNDDVIGESTELTFDNLLNQQIWSTNGKATVVFRSAADLPLSVGSMAPAIQDGLALDALYFEDGGNDDGGSTYLISAEKVEGEKASYACQIDSTQMGNILYGSIIYAALGFTFPDGCFDPADSEFANTMAKFSLYAVRSDSNSEFIGATDVKTVGELIGEKASFVDGNGYVVFRSVVPTAFASPVVRLGELTSMQVTSVSYKLEPSATPNVELEVISADGGYAIACAGAPQGLNINAPQDYTGLTAGLVAVDGQKELFGYDTVKVRVIDRKDGLSCPSPQAQDGTVLAVSGRLGPKDLEAGAVTFTNGAGSATLVLGQ